MTQFVPTRPVVRAAATLLGTVLGGAGPADRALSAFFRENRSLGPRERAFVAEAVYAVLRRRRSLATAAAAETPMALILAAQVRVLGYSLRALDGIVSESEREMLKRMRAVDAAQWPEAIRADLPDWLWHRLAAQQRPDEAMKIAASMLIPAPLDLRVNLARTTREDVLAQFASAGIPSEPTPYSPAGVRLAGKPPINRHPLFLDGLIEVQDEGSQLLAYLLSPRRGEMVADFCAGAGGKTLALSMLMKGAGRIYAMDVSQRRLRELSPRAARAGISNVHPLVLSDENDLRARRLSGKLDRVLVDAPCSGFGTLRRNPDLKWRHGPEAIEELAQKQRRILLAGARLVKPGGRLVYATCSILQEENETVVADFLASHPSFKPVSCEEIFRTQRIQLDGGDPLRLWPHRHGTDGFFAAAFQRAAG